MEEFVTGFCFAAKICTRCYWTEMQGQDIQSHFSHEHTNLYSVVTAAAWNHWSAVQLQSLIRSLNSFCIWLGDMCLSGRWTHNEVEQNVFISIQSQHKTGGLQWLVLASRGQHFTGSDMTTRTSFNTDRQTHQRVLLDGRIHWKVWTIVTIQM